MGLFETDGESGFGLSGTLLEEKFSDASDNFTFDFTARQDYSYYVQAIKEQYWNDQSNSITFVHELGGIDNLTVYLQPEGWLNLHLLNDVPSSIYDVISLNTPEGNAGGPYTGSSVDTNIIITGFGNSTNEIYWGIYFIDSLIITSSVDVYLTSFDTTYYEIIY